MDWMNVFFAPNTQTLQREPMYRYAAGREHPFFAVEQRLRLIDQIQFNQVPPLKYRSFKKWPINNLPDPLLLMTYSMADAGHVEIDVINSYLIAVESYLLGINGRNKWHLKHHNGVYTITGLNHTINSDSIFQSDSDYIQNWQD